MTGFINYLINGISLGSVYAIIALGYTMVYGIAKMLNFAHGDIIMVGSYVVFITTHSMGMPVFLSVLLSVIVCTVLGIVIERVAYKPLRDASPLSVLITAIGVSYLLQNVALLLFGADTKSFTSVVTIPALKFADGAITVTGETLVTIVSCIVIMIGLTTFINKTKAGRIGRPRCRHPDGGKRKRNHRAHIRDRLRPRCRGRCLTLLRLSVPDSLHRIHARHQGLRGSRIRRNRFHPRRVDRRNPSGNH